MLWRLYANAGLALATCAPTPLKVLPASDWLPAPPSTLLRPNGWLFAG